MDIQASRRVGLSSTGTAPFLETRSRAVPRGTDVFTRVGSAAKPLALETPRRDIARVDRTLQRTAAHLRATQQIDGRWDTVYVGGNTQMALAAIALADAGVSTDAAKDADVIAHFAKQQLADGSFPTIPGEPADPATTRLVSLALSMMAKREPSLAAQASAMAAKCDQFIAQHPTHISDGVYSLIANLFSDIVRDDSHLIPAIPMAAMLAKAGDALVADRISGLARIYLPAFSLLLEQHARKTSWLGGALGALDNNVCKGFEKELMRTQDGDGAWGWTGLGTALALMALKRQGYTRDNSATVRRGVEFLTRLRAMDVTAWTHGDAWDTAGATLTLQTIDPQADVSKGIDELLHGQLADAAL